VNLMYSMHTYELGFLSVFFPGSKVTDTIRKGIIDVEPYANNTELLMVGNVAALTGELEICSSHLNCDN
jgi:phosphate/sulfate permease